MRPYKHDTLLRSLLLLETHCRGSTHNDALLRARPLRKHISGAPSFDKPISKRPCNLGDIFKEPSLSWYIAHCWGQGATILETLLEPNTPNGTLIESARLWRHVAFFRSSTLNNYMRCRLVSLCVNRYFIVSRLTNMSKICTCLLIVFTLFIVHTVERLLFAFNLPNCRTKKFSENWQFCYKQHPPTHSFYYCVIFAFDKKNRD